MNPVKPRQLEADSQTIDTYEGKQGKLHMLHQIKASVCVYAVIISKYTTKIVGTQNRQVACVYGTQDQKQSTFNTFKPAQ